MTGPTAVGKTGLSIRLARELDTVILSADSRQFYKGMKIGTAAPGEKELSMAKHYFAGHLELGDYYNVSRFEQEALAVLKKEFQNHDQIILTGGSGLYIDALCYGVDEFPDPEPELRASLKKQYEKNGIAWLQHEARKLDPDYYAEVDTKNPNRLLRAIEVCMATGQPYSKQRKGTKKERPFGMVYIALNRPRQELFERINQRTGLMIEKGLIDEVRSLRQYRHLNALNTVGYKEIFAYLDGKFTKEEAIEKIKTNTRRYAKRQITWFKKRPDYHWIHPGEYEKILQLIKS